MGIEKETSHDVSEPAKSPEPKKETTAAKAIETSKAGAAGAWDRVIDSDATWGMAQLLAGGLLIGLGVVWYVRRRRAANMTEKYAE